MIGFKCYGAFGDRVSPKLMLRGERVGTKNNLGRSFSFPAFELRASFRYSLSGATSLATLAGHSSFVGCQVGSGL